MKPNTPPYQCAGPDQYFFWDGIHPTRAIHRLSTREVIRQVGNDCPPLERGRARSPRSGGQPDRPTNTVAGGPQMGQNPPPARGHFPAFLEAIGRVTNRPRRWV